MSKKTIYRIQSKTVYEAVKSLFESYGLHKLSAKKVARYLVESDLCGQNSHGVARIPL